MIIEIFVLALVTTVRPTSLAAVSILLTRDARRTLLLAYIVTGLAFTIGFGLAIVYAFHGIHLGSGRNHTSATAQLIGGALAIAFGLAVLTRRIHPSTRHDAPKLGLGTRVTKALDQHVTRRTAALAGPATHIPGLFYVIALNVIVASEVRISQSTFAVLVYNVVWFALPIIALGACILRPATASGIVVAVERWAREHARPILLVASFGIGTTLLVRGALGL